MLATGAEEVRGWELRDLKISSASCGASERLSRGGPLVVDRGERR